MCHVLHKQFVQSFKLRFQSFAFNIKMMLELEEKETYIYQPMHLKKKKSSLPLSICCKMNEVICSFLSLESSYVPGWQDRVWWALMSILKLLFKNKVLIVLMEDEALFN